ADAACTRCRSAVLQPPWPARAGPRSTEMLFAGGDMFSPRRTWLRPKDLCTSTNSIASGSPDARISPVWNSNSCSSPPGEEGCGSWTAMSASDRGAWVGAPEDLCAEHSDQVHENQVKHHRLRRRGSHSDGAAAGVVAVIAGEE